MIKFLYNFLYKIKRKYEQYYFWNISPKEGLRKIQTQNVIYGKNTPPPYFRKYLYKQGS